MLSKIGNYSPSFSSIYRVRIDKDALPESKYDAHNKITDKLDKLGGKPDRRIDYNNLYSRAAYKKYYIHREGDEGVNYTGAKLEENTYTYLIFTGDEKRDAIFAVNNDPPVNFPKKDYPEYRKFVMRHILEGKEIKDHTIHNLSELEGLNLDFES